MASPIRPDGDRHLGVTGLAVMGRNLARNIARHGFPVAVHNRTQARTDELLGSYGHEGDIVGAAEPADLVAALSRPRAVVVMVKAGTPVDAVIDELRPLLDEGDVIVDGGNSSFADTERRVADLAAEGIRYLGCGVSGGEEGALHGPSLMPGGSREAYELVEPVLTAIAAQVDGTPCCTYIGDGGAGHYVKMVHNGIEYADMQLIAEAYDLLGHALGLDNDEMAAVFRRWNEGDLDSFLIEITAQVLDRADDDGSGEEIRASAVGGSVDVDDGDVDGRLLDVILDAAEQKGTGRLTAIQALELGTPLTAITEAVFARVLSSFKDERVAASAVLPGPEPSEPGFAVDDLRDALYGAKIVAYAQGFDQLRRASEEHDWDLHLDRLATIWRGGCIIRARFLDRIRDAYETDEPPANLVLAPAFTDALAETLPAWRRVVAGAVALGIPVPASSSALAWYDGYRRDRSPANLIQAQRDLFGAHTFRRTDREGAFHATWIPTDDADT